MTSNESPLMTERHGFFPSDGHALFGVLYGSEHLSADRGVVLCAPFGEEALWSQRVFVSLARDLSAAGTPVLRFDYGGTGDSDLDFEDSTIRSRLNDIGSAIAFLQEQCRVRSVTLLGLGLGASLAAQKAEDEPVVQRLVLWQPVLTGATYVREILRTNIATQLAIYKEIRHKSEQLIGFLKEGRTVNFDGYELSHTLFEELSRIDLLGAPKSFAGKTLLVQVARQHGLPASQMVDLQALYRQCDLAVAAEEPFWKEIKTYYERADELFGITMKWLNDE